MASKKYKFLFGLLCLATSGAFAQGYDVMDSAVVPAKRIPQHNEFMNNSYAFPAKPRSQWELGVKGGMFNVIGDVPAIIPTLGAGAHVRKAFGYVFSMRLEYMYGQAKGLNWQRRSDGFSDPVAAAGYDAFNTYYDNYKTRVHDLGLQGVISFNNLRFHKKQSNFVGYLFAGLGGTVSKTHLDLYNDNGVRHNFNTVSGNNWDNRKDTRDALKDILDDDYETRAQSENQRKLFKENFYFSGTLGAGMAFRLGKRVNLAIEDRITFTGSDYLDGTQNQNAASGILSPEKDLMNFLSVGLNFNIGNKTRSVEPLWWLNPLDYAYSEINQPRHMKLPKPILDDSDGDGVPDQFDLEPNTPAGAPVDARGVARDTDGDGVPDYRDKELITPTQCQPVDADGVGKCPEPACCEELRKLIEEGNFRNCGIGDLPSVSFAGRNVALSRDAQAVLAGVAAKIRNNPSCRIAVVGYGDANKAAQQLSWDRVNAVINYLVEKEGISSDRFIFKYGEAGGDANTVDLRDGTNDQGPNTVPAPHPNLRKRK